MSRRYRDNLSGRMCASFQILHISLHMLLSLIQIYIWGCIWEGLSNFSFGCNFPIHLTKRPSINPSCFCFIYLHVREALHFQSLWKWVKRFTDPHAYVLLRQGCHWNYISSSEYYAKAQFWKFEHYDQCSLQLRQHHIFLLSQMSFDFNLDCRNHHYCLSSFSWVEGTYFF